jgi:hypothetical protein
MRWLWGVGAVGAGAVLGAAVLFLGALTYDVVVGGPKDLDAAVRVAVWVTLGGAATGAAEEKAHQEACPCGEVVQGRQPSRSTCATGRGRSHRRHIS